MSALSLFLNIQYYHLLYIGTQIYGERNSLFSSLPLNERLYTAAEEVLVLVQEVLPLPFSEVCIYPVFCLVSRCVFFSGAVVLQTEEGGGSDSTSSSSTGGGGGGSTSSQYGFSSSFSPSLASSSQQYYFRISPFCLLAFHFRLQRVEQQVEEKRLAAQTRDVFYCPVCRTQYDAMEAQLLDIDPRDAHFLCKFCNEKLEHEVSRP